MNDIICKANMIHTKFGDAAEIEFYEKYKLAEDHYEFKGMHEDGNGMLYSIWYKSPYLYAYQVQVI